MQIRRNGAWAPLSTGKAYVNGAWRTLVNGKGYIGGSWRSIVSFVQTLTLTVNNDSRVVTSTTISGTDFATPEGGLAPISYSWSLVSSSGLSSISLTGTATAIVTVNATLIGGPGSSGSANLSCTATDSLGHSATATGSLTFNYKTTGDG